MDEKFYIVIGILFYLSLLGFFVYILWNDVNAASVFDGWVPDYP